MIFIRVRLEYYLSSISSYLDLLYLIDYRCILATITIIKYKVIYLVNARYTR